MSLLPNAKETTYHLFVQCRHVRKLWHALTKWCRYFLNIKLELKPEVIIFNEYCGSRANLVNLLILIMKRYVYVSKCKNKELSFIGYISQIHYIKQIENLTALRNQKTNLHKKKWENFLE